MAGIVVELIVSWLLLWFFYKKSLLVLGIMPTKKRTTQLLFGLLVSAACCMVYHLLFSAVGSNRWALNPEYTIRALAGSLVWMLVSVLYEELIFRGALLYILMRKKGVVTACAISALCFGIYHWFTTGTLGSLVPMSYVFILTGSWGFMFAMAFAKTKSMFLPIGLHFGWNVVNTVVFSQGPLGKQLFISTGAHKVSDSLSVLFFLFQWLAVPLYTWLYLKRR